MSAGDEPSALRERLAALIASLAPDRSDPAPCPYLEGRDSRLLALRPERLAGPVYRAFLDLNFRRMGDLVYRPECDGCRECRQSRVDVRAFAPSRAQRRCARRNADVAATAGPPDPTEEKRELYARYLARRHDGQMTGSREEFLALHREAAPFTREVVFRESSGRLVGAGIFDELDDALSAVYFYFDPDLGARSPGVLNVLWLLDRCRRSGRPWLYLGYLVESAPTMAYKAAYRPQQVLGEDGRWR